MPNPPKPLRGGPADADLWLLHARTAFLRTIDEEAPHVRRGLIDVVGSAHAALLRDTGLTPPLTVAALCSLASHRPAAELLEKVNLWASRFNLERDGWILDAALRYLARAEVLGEDVPLVLGAPTGVSFWQPALELSPPTYRPETQTRADYLRRADEYASAVDAAYRAAGWRNSPHWPELAEHLRRLVRHQVLGLTYAEVEPNAAVSTVMRSIKEVATMLPITLRKAPGRK